VVALAPIVPGLTSATKEKFTCLFATGLPVASRNTTEIVERFAVEPLALGEMALGRACTTIEVAVVASNDRGRVATEAPEPDPTLAVMVPVPAEVEETETEASPLTFVTAVLAVKVPRVVLNETVCPTCGVPATRYRAVTTWLEPIETVELAAGDMKTKSEPLTFIA
jgi:hypothetical protein